MKIRKVISMVMTMAVVMGLVSGCGNDSGSGNNSSADNGSQSSETQNISSESSESSDAAEEETPDSDEFYENGLSKTEKVTLKFGVFDGGTGTGSVEAGIKEFEKLYPNVTIELTASPDIKTLIDTKIGAGDDEDMFDLFTWVDNKRDLIAAGKLEPLDDVWDMEVQDTPGTTLAEICDNNVVECSYCVGWPDGQKHVYGIQDSDGAYYGVYFDKALFQEKGWNQNPQTWQEFLDLCAEIKEDGVVPFVYTGVYPSYLDMLITGKIFELADEAGELAAYQEAYDNYGSVYYTSPYVVAMWKKMAELAELGYIHEGSVGMNHTQSQMQIIQGNSAMVVTGSWVGNEMADSVPEGFEWGYMVVPFRETTDTPMHVSADAHESVYQIWAGKSETNKAWCKEFIRILFDMDCQVALAKNGSIPTRKDYSEDPERTELLQQAVKTTMEYFAANEVVSNSNLAGRESQPTGAALTEASQYYHDNFSAMIFGEIDIEEVLNECQRLLDSAWE